MVLLVIRIVTKYNYRSYLIIWKFKHFWVKKLQYLLVHFTIQNRLFWHSSCFKCVWRPNSIPNHSTYYIFICQWNYKLFRLDQKVMQDTCQKWLQLNILKQNTPNCQNSFSYVATRCIRLWFNVGLSSSKCYNGALKSIVDSLLSIHIT